MRRERLIYPALFLITAAVFWPVAHSQFINLDDWMYVTANGMVRAGLTANSMHWALISTDWSNWHPLTWMSHMLDCQLFGLKPGPPHLENLLLHCANTLLLFHLLRRMTRELWPSALVAAFFALHPLHVESVAWISERKDVLSTFFGLLSLLMYVSYVRAGKAKEEGGRRNAEVGGPKQEGAKRGKETGRKTEEKGRKADSPPPNPPAGTPGFVSRHSGAGVYYGLSLLFFVLGLMSKPMLVTWPFVMLLLDYWPLNRGARHVAMVEKPADVNRRRPMLAFLPSPVAILDKLPFLALSIASSAVTVYAQRAGGSMISISRIAFNERIDNALLSYVRYLAKAFWPENMAAFYPHPFEWPDSEVLGAALLLGAISVAVLFQMRRRRFLAVGWFWFLGTLVPVIGLLQVGAQAMADRYMYIPSIGLFVMVVWGARDIANHFRRARPALIAAGAAALAGCIVVTSVQVRYWRNSETLFRHALAVTQNNLAAEFLLGDALVKERKPEEGMEHLERALQLNPDYPAANAKMADLLARRGRFHESIEHYRAILRTRPTSVTVMNNLAWMMATNPDPGVRDGAEAVRLAEKACSLTQYRETICVGTLAAAYAEAGRFDEAVRAGEKARDLALARGQKELAGKNEELIHLYQARKPCRETPPGPVVPPASEPAPL